MKVNPDTIQDSVICMVLSVVGDLTIDGDKLRFVKRYMELPDNEKYLALCCIMDNVINITDPIIMGGLRPISKDNLEVKYWIRQRGEIKNKVMDMSTLVSNEYKEYIKTRVKKEVVEVEKTEEEKQVETYKDILNRQWASGNKWKELLNTSFGTRKLLDYDDVLFLCKKAQSDVYQQLAKDGLIDVDVSETLVNGLWNSEN